LRTLEDSLLEGLERELQSVTTQIRQIVQHIELVEEKKKAGRKNLDKRYLHLDKQYRALDRHSLALMKMMCRFIRHKCRLIKMHYQIMKTVNKRNDLDLFAYRESPPPPSGIDSLLPVFIRSYKKTKYFYSKLFRKSMDLTDDQWNTVKDLLPRKVMQGAGRPPQSTRDVLNGILWKLRTAASWNDLPSQYPSHQTCYRYYTAWAKADTLDQVIRALVRHLNQGDFSLFDSLENGDIELIEMAKQTHIHFAPRLQDTWQASTALLILQVFITKKRKQDKSIKKITQSYQLSD
jgi:transposase